MSAPSAFPVLTPNLLTVGKEQSVVVEFPRDLPRNVLITFDFYYENSFKKLATVPTVILGPRAVRANFIEFHKPGEVEVVLKIAHEESTLFPKFKLHVQSPIEAIFHGIPLAPRGSNQAAILCSILTYLMHSEDELKDKHLRSHVDVILCNILQAMPEIGHSDWKMSALLCGSYGANENLLHFCIRRKLAGMAEFLLQPKMIAGRTHLLQSRALDGKTPAELARKSGMRRVHEMVEKSLGTSETGESSELQASSLVVTQDAPHSRKHPKSAHGNQRRPRAHTQFDGGAVDVGPLPLFIPKEQPRAKKKKGVAKRLKRVFKGDTKDKNAVVISSPYPPPPVEFNDFATEPGGFDEIDRAATPDSLPSSLPSSTLVHDLDGYLGVSSESKEDIRRSWPRTDSPVTGSRRDAIEGSGRTSFTPKSGSPSSPPRNPPIHSSMLSGSRGQGSPIQRLSNPRPRSLPPADTSGITNAILDLKKKSLYTAKVTRLYRWASGPHRSLILKEGDIVYVTQEVNEDTCLGVCHHCYGRFPKTILQPLTAEEREQLEAEVSEDSDSDVYDEVDDVRAVYSVPRNVTLISSSDSDSEHLYDVPTRHDELWKLHPHLRSLPANHYRVPRRYKVPTMNPNGSNSPQLGRLLSNYSTSSSHDTGLDRLGLSNTSPHESSTSNAMSPDHEPAPTSSLVVQKSPSIPRSMKLRNAAFRQSRTLDTHSDPNLLEYMGAESDEDDDFNMVQRWDSCEITELRLSGDKTESGTESESEEAYDDLAGVTQQMQTQEVSTEQKMPEITEERVPVVDTELDLLRGKKSSDGIRTSANVEEFPPAIGPKPKIPLRSTISTETATELVLDQTLEPSNPPPVGPKPKPSARKCGNETMGKSKDGEEVLYDNTRVSDNTGSRPLLLNAEASLQAPKSTEPERPPMVTTGDSDAGTVSPKPDSTSPISSPPTVGINLPPLPPKPKPRKPPVRATVSSPLASATPPAPPALPERSQTLRETNTGTQRMVSYPPTVPAKPVPNVRKHQSERKPASPRLGQMGNKPVPPPVSPKPARKLIPPQ